MKNRNDDCCGEFRMVSEGWTRGPVVVRGHHRKETVRQPHYKGLIFNVLPSVVEF